MADTDPLYDPNAKYDKHTMKASIQYDKYIYIVQEHSVIVI